VKSDAERKLDAIVGAALRGIIESGADDEFVGEFAERHRARVAQVLGAPATQLSPPDIASVVAQAVTEAFSKFGGATKATKVTTKRVNIYVNGRRTSAVISVDSFGKLIERQGGKQQAVKFIEGLANSESTPENRGRSASLEQKIQSYLMSVETKQPVSSARH